MRLAVLGGSFNPIHHGHLFLADMVLSRLRYDRVVLVPAYRSPFKLDAVGMEGSARDRLEMIAGSIAGNPRLTVDDCELSREGISYTADTLEDIISRYMPDGKPGLIIGDDLAADYIKWRRSEAILAMADIIVARRVCPGKPDVPFPFTQIDNDVMDISSAAVRERIARGGDWHSLVAPAARTIIEDKGLYGCGSHSAESNAAESNAAESNAAESPLDSLVLRVEEAARKSLSMERFLHSRNTALFAWDMCRRLQNGGAYRLDERQAYLAGIAHDLGKEFSDREQLRLAKSDGKKISRMEKDKPTLLHGRVSAVLLKERFKVYDSAVLEAVALHTYGGVNMGPLAKIIYIADKLEVSRDRYDPALRKLAYTATNLDEIFMATLDYTVSSLRKRKLNLSAETLRLLESMKGL